MINFRLDENSVDDLLALTKGEFPITREEALAICSSVHPTMPCTRVYGCYHNGTELVASMTATYSIVFPHADGSRIVHISGASTRPDMRHKGLATTLLEAIESDARDYFHADYLCCDSIADKFYEKNGYRLAQESRLWKKI